MPVHEEEQPQQRPLTPLRPWVREDETPAPDVPTTPEPDAETLALLRGRVTGELAETYPQFAGTLAAERAA